MANRAYGREHRVGDFLQRELSALIRSELRDPRIGMVTINEVRVAKDLAYADVYVSQLGRDEPEDTSEAREDLLHALRGAAGLLRSLLAKSATMRIVPRLRFQYDTGLESGMRMDKLIHEALAKDRAAAAQTARGELVEPSTSVDGTANEIAKAEDNAASAALSMPVPGAAS